jgi:hypothetical protein
MRHKVAIDPILTIRSVGYAFNEQFKEINLFPKKAAVIPRGVSRQLCVKRNDSRKLWRNAEAPAPPSPRAH